MSLPVAIQSDAIKSDLTAINVTDEVILKLKADYLHLTIAGPDDKEGYEKVKKARLECRALRLAAEKVCKEGREEAIQIQKLWIAAEKDVVGRIREVEDPLMERQKFIDDYHARIEQERIEAEERAKREAEEAERLERERVEREIHEKAVARMEVIAKLGSVLSYEEARILTDGQFDDREQLAIEQAEQRRREREEMEAMKAKLAALEAEKVKKSVEQDANDASMEELQAASDILDKVQGNEWKPVPIEEVMVTLTTKSIEIEEVMVTLTTKSIEIKDIARLLIPAHHGESKATLVGVANLLNEIKLVLEQSKALGQEDTELVATLMGMVTRNLIHEVVNE